MRRTVPYQFPFAKYPAVRLALLLALGIVLSKLASMDIWFWAGLFGVIILVWIVTTYLFHKTLHPKYSYLAVACYLCGIICFGSFWHTFFDQRNQPPSARLLSAYTWKSIEASGTIQNIQQTSSGKFQLDIAVNHTVLEDSLIWKESYELRTIYNSNGQELPKSAELGAAIHFTATVYPLKSKRNPYDFDYKQYLASRHIYEQAGIDKIYRITPNNNWLSWNWWRQCTLQLIEHNFTGQTIPLAKALLIGYKNDLGHNEKIAFSRVGLSHIMAVSGLHVGFIIAPFWLIIPFLWSFRWGKQIGLFIFCTMLLFYCGLTGFSASVTRAAITGSLLTYGRLFYKSRDSKNLTAVAAIIILLIDPNQLFEIGFQLSFSAVYIILLVMPVFQQLIPQRLQHRWYSIPLMIVIVSICVQFGLYPLLSHYFGEFSLVGPLANAVIVPWLSVMIPYALLLLPFSAFFPTAGFMMNAPCRWFLYFLHWFVVHVSTWSWSWIQTPATGIFIFVIWIAAIFLIASLPIAKFRWKILIIFLAFLCLQQLNTLRRKLRVPRLSITMLDVGQGDATFISTASGKHFLIDTGRWTPTYNSARYVIIPHLKALGVKKLDAIFLSHPHADHIGGMPELINSIPIDTIYNSGSVYHSKLYKRYLKDAEQHHIPVKALHAGMIVPLDKSLRIYIYGPSDENHQSDVNEHSLIEELVYGKEQFLFMGDAGHAEEQNLLDHFGKLINTDFLKVGHHGSKTSSSIDFLKVATPAVSAVSLAKKNRFHFPNIKTIDHLKHSGTKLYFTSLQGALEFISNGSSIKRKKWR